MRKLTPIFKDYIWGGTRLKTEYGKQTDLPRVAESWELTGEPVLIKLIDAKESLSVQVHPDDEYARAHENSVGKTEMWVILDCEPGAFLCFGFTRELTRDEVRARVDNGTLTEVLRKLPVRRGDAVFIPAGTVHAIGAGIVLAEIQQNSNVTYRLYDFGRLDADGNPRPLHIEQALDVALLKPSPLTAPGRGEARVSADFREERLAGCEYFTVDRVALSGTYTQTAPGFRSVLCCEGDCTAGCGGETLRITKGDSVYIPAGSGELTLSGGATVLVCGQFTDNR
ncbi:MAG: class I mannose-6-phosphate isomerase [Oscillospiraceae bacterium]|jgi:mannose-6-phosphate isomerase|nr:class I mannose-6-phosphate isomerase [Oscillospiraceae bacterium]